VKRTRSAFLIIAVLFSLGIISPGLAVATVGKAGPDTALTPDGEWTQLSGGASQWYAFDYAGNGSQVQVRLEAMPEGSAGF